MTDLEKVWLFCNEHPLWTEEATHTVRSEIFCEDHRRVYIGICFAGSFDVRFMPPPRRQGQAIRTLDLGCGIGFWTTEFSMRGLSPILAADLTPSAFQIVRKRLDAYGVEAEFTLVLKLGGAVGISMYYRNILLQLWLCLRWLDHRLGFMMYANVRKKCAV
jgi:hypothetical protein